MGLLEVRMSQFLGHAFDALFGCHHSNLSRAFTIKGRTYKVCTDCGREFDYSLETMSVMDTSSASHVYPVAVPHAAH